MTRTRRLLALLLLLAALAAPHAPRAAEAPPHIWFSPLDQIQRPNDVPGRSADFMELFNPNAPWQQVAGRIDVFSFYPQFFRRASDAQLTAAFAWLARHHIGIAVETGLLHPREDCARREGFDGDQQAMAQRIRRLGGTLRFVVGDSTLFAGHGFDGPRACHMSAAEVAHDAAEGARQFRSVFPDIRFLDAEPVGNFHEPDWPAQLAAFLTAFKRDEGNGFVAVVADVAWWEPGWQDRVKKLAATLHGLGMPIGAFYDGNPHAESDAQWVAQARQNAAAFEALLGRAPDYALLQSWHPHPTRVLPETAPDSFAGYALGYIRAHP